MGILEFAVIFCLVVAMYNLQQMKMALNNKGFAVSMFSSWLADYRNFKGLIEKELDQSAKIKYQQTLNGFHFSLAGMALFAGMILFNRL